MYYIYIIIFFDEWYFYVLNVVCLDFVDGIENWIYFLCFIWIFFLIGILLYCLLFIGVEMFFSVLFVKVLYFFIFVWCKCLYFL